MLVQPEIPPNTGSVARLCAATGIRLHLVRPLGFSLEDRYLKRAGLDYWPHVDLHVHDDWEEFRASERPTHPLCFSARAARSYTAAPLAEVTPFDPKTELQEALHAAGSEPPEYLLEMVEGPEHAPTFVTVVTIDVQIAGRGRGSTKKAAQQEAAAQALGRMYWTTSAPQLADSQRVFIESAMLFQDTAALPQKLQAPAQAA